MKLSVFQFVPIFKEKIANCHGHYRPQSCTTPSFEIETLCGIGRNQESRYCATTARHTEGASRMCGLIQSQFNAGFIN